LGSAVNYEDVPQLAETLLRLLRTPDAKASMRNNFSRAIQSLTWERVTEPLQEFCRNPRKAPDSDFVHTSQVTEAVYGAYRNPSTNLGKAWLRLRRRGFASMIREAKSYLLWRLRGPQ
jgi:hypothetical protein